MSVHPLRSARAKVTARAAKRTTLGAACGAPQSQRRAVTLSVALGLSVLLSGLVTQAAAPSHAGAKKQLIVKKLSSADAQTAFKISVRRIPVRHSIYYPTTWEIPTTEHTELRIVKLLPCRPTHNHGNFECSFVSEADLWWDPPFTFQGVPPWDEQRACTPQYHCCTVWSIPVLLSQILNVNVPHPKKSSVVVLHPHDKRRKVLVSYFQLDPPPARAGCHEPSTQPPPYLNPDN